MERDVRGTGKGEKKTNSLWCPLIRALPTFSLRGRRHHGFTLIELLVIVLIIGILAAIALPQYEKAIEKSRAAEAMVILRSIADANRRYYMANGEYTWSLADLDIEVPGKDVTDNEMDRKQTKYFEYGSRPASKTDTRGMIAVANKIPIGTTYILSIYADKEGIYCSAYNQKGLNICKMLGAKEAVATGTYYHIDI